MLAHRQFRWLLWLVCSTMLVASFANRGEARPKYKAVFEKTYPEFVKKDGKLTCAFCHSGGDDKKRRNHYGEALAKELGEKNVREEEKIIEALKAIEDGECRTGKWKPLLEKGIPPCLCRGTDLDAGSYVSKQLRREQIRDHSSSSE